MKNEELVERYFLGELSAEELQNFKQLLASDADFNEEVRYQENLKSVLIAEEESQFKKTLSGFEEKQSKGLNKRIFMVAASLLVLVAVSSIILLQQPTNETLYASNFTPYANIIQPVVRGEIADDIKTKAFVAYENKQYDLAATYFKTLSLQTDQEYVTFYLGIASLANDQTSEAIAIFQKIIEVQGEFQSQAHWYLALAYLKQNTSEKAKPLLEILVKNQGYNALNAFVILEKIK